MVGHRLSIQASGELVVVVVVVVAAAVVVVVVVVVVGVVVVAACREACPILTSCDDTASGGIRNKKN